MSRKEDAKIFIGGLSIDATERQIGHTFSRFGKVLDVQIMVERDTGRPRGFGFVTFSDKRALEAAISEMHNKKLYGRQISVNKAAPKVASDGTGSECLKCGHLGHRTLECRLGGGQRSSPRSRIDGSGRERFGRDRYHERYADDRYGGGRYDGNRYGDRDRLDAKDSRYNGGHYSPVGGRLTSGRYGDRPDRYPSSGYNKERSFERDDSGGSGGGNGYGSGGPARYDGGGSYRVRPNRYPSSGHNKERSFERDGGGGGDGYGSGGPARYDGGGRYRVRPGPYDRLGRGSSPSSLDDDRY